MTLKQLPSTGDLGLLGREGYPYLPESSLRHAVNAALVLGMPLLITGEPGCGKTDLAFALARYMLGGNQANVSTEFPAGWDADDQFKYGLLQCYVRSDTEARDLLYHYDAVRRFGDVQMKDPLASDPLASDPRNYIDLLPLGIAIAQASQGQRRVVLIDEIDKAPRDLPNDLLRELEQCRFQIKEIAGRDFDAPFEWHAHIPLVAQMGVDTAQVDRDQVRPLVIITSNEERVLPDAFLRRCVFYNLAFPTAARLSEILDRRFGQDQHHPTAIKTFMGLRKDPELRKKPSTSELIRWVDALRQIIGWDAAINLLSRFKPDGNGRLPQDLTDLPALSCLIKTPEDWRRFVR